jgi:hypothetical protein
MLFLYDRKDVLEVASSHDSFVQLNLDRRGAATGARIFARGWAGPLPDLASRTRERNPIVLSCFADPMAVWLITPWIVASVRVSTRIGEPPT